MFEACVDALFFGGKDAGKGEGFLQEFVFGVGGFDNAHANGIIAAHTLSCEQEAVGGSKGECSTDQFAHAGCKGDIDIDFWEAEPAAILAHKAEVEGTRPDRAEAKAVSIECAEGGFGKSKCAMCHLGDLAHKVGECFGACLGKPLQIDACAKVFFSVTRPDHRFDIAVFFELVEGVDDLLQTSAIHAVVFFALEGHADDIVVAFAVKEREGHDGAFLCDRSGAVETDVSKHQPVVGAYCIRPRPKNGLVRTKLRKSDVKEMKKGCKDHRAAL